VDNLPDYAARRVARETSHLGIVVHDHPVGVDTTLDVGHPGSSWQQSMKFA
jgi:hypothetical protein